MKSRIHWIILLLATNLFFSFVVWLTAPDAIAHILIMLLLFTLMIILTAYLINRRLQTRQIQSLEQFLAKPDSQTEEKLLATFDKCWHPVIQNASAQIMQQEQMIKESQLELLNYQEFIEGWTHEIKTPLSLATLVLENHKEDMSPYIYQRMEHVRYTIHSDVEKILYYARLQADHMDYKFETINLSDCLQGCLEHFYGISEEKGIDLQLDILPLKIVSDKKVLSFMISQLLSNTFKYTAAHNGIVKISTWQDCQEGGKIHLSVGDNGKGVPLEDLPFLFDKGFTGNHRERQDATGMGLYLTKKYAERLSIEIEIDISSTTGAGFEIQLIFPTIV